MQTSYSDFYATLNSLLFVIYWLLVVITTLRIVTKRRPTSYVVAWLLIIYILPVVGVFLYFLLGEAHLGQTRVLRAQKMAPKITQFIHQINQYPAIFASEVSNVAKPIFQLCKHQTGLNGIKGNHIDRLSETDTVFNQLLIDIEMAQTNIEMVFYIWLPGGRVQEVEQALIRAAKRGVSCHIMLDSAGSRTFLRSQSAQRLRQAGIKVKEVLKVNLLRFMFRRLDLRQHRKIIIIDHHICYTGSMNMVDPRLFKQNKNVGEWVDLMIRIQGPVTMLMSAIYASNWQMETGQQLALPKVADFAESPDEMGHCVQLIPSGPGYSENMIHQVLLTAIYAAQQQVILTTPYLVPSDALLQAICTTAQRGVEVIIIIPKNIDSVMVKWASRAFFSDLLSAGVKLYAFENNLLHTKSVLIDQQLSFVGTVNLDMRSLWLNFEITAVIDDRDFGFDLYELTQSYLAESVAIDKTRWLKRPFWQHIIERLFYFFAPLL